MNCWRERAHLGRCGGDEMLLSLPDVRQTAGHDCGEAAVKCVLEFHGIKAAVRLATPSHGTDPTQIEAALRNIGCGVMAGEMTVDDLRHFADCGRPVIALVHWPEGQDSHWIVIRGVSRGTVYFHDPIDGPSKCGARDFEAAWKASGRVGAYRRWGIAPWVS